MTTSSVDDKLRIFRNAALPHVISGRIAEKDLWLVDENYLSKMGCSLLKGREVTEVHPKQKQVTYKDGGRESYDTLLVASGSRPVTLNIPGLDEVGFATFHTIGDCQRLQQQLQGKQNVAIYGGGLVAVELAVALLEAGYKVKLIVRSRILRRYFEQDAGDMIEDILKSHGAQIFKGSEIKEVKRNSKGIEIALSDGNSLNTDIIAIALGVRPSALFLEESGVNIKEGVMVDPRMKTNVADIYAAGDVAESPDFFTGNPGLNPILPSAVDQGAVAGSNMAGEGLDYEGWLPMNILSFFGHRALSVGTLDSGEFHILADRDTQKKQYKKLAYKDGRLAGASFLDVDLFPGVIQYLIRKRINLGQHVELLLQKPKEISTWLMLEAERKETLSLEV
ncbi:NADH-dependent phenylglyoxylate dehydrogenase subunit epsilon [subsurface metagenome]